ncbi:unnamed protein product [Linum tenue]|uniref:Uncharacterized protein n=1 Tax=Linum tenue TaxID=586396 RepID=A0AAV0RDG8_9ROSI|nr:unnamed protein product [Linum tenue]
MKHEALSQPTCTMTLVCNSTSHLLIDDDTHKVEQNKKRKDSVKKKAEDEEIPKKNMEDSKICFLSSFCWTMKPAEKTRSKGDEEKVEGCGGDTRRLRRRTVRELRIEQTSLPEKERAKNNKENQTSSLAGADRTLQMLQLSNKLKKDKRQRNSMEQLILVEGRIEWQEIRRIIACLYR